MSLRPSTRTTVCASVRVLDLRVCVHSSETTLDTLVRSRFQSLYTQVMTLIIEYLSVSDQSGPLYVSCTFSLRSTLVSSTDHEIRQDKEVTLIERYAFPPGHISLELQRTFLTPKTSVSRLKFIVQRIIFTTLVCI